MRRVNAESREACQRNRSETAIKTSARSEVMVARAGRLRSWRQENLEVARAIAAHARTFIDHEGKRPTQIERALIPLLPGFRRNVQVKAGAMRKRVDFVGPFLVEVDGLYHFLPLAGEEKFRQARERDRALCEWATTAGRPLVRVAADCFARDELREVWAPKVKAALRDPPAGVTLVGDLYYGVDWPRVRWLTLGSATPDTCSSSTTG